MVDSVLCLVKLKPGTSATQGTRTAPRDDTLDPASA